MFLTKIRSIIITPRVSEKIIDGTIRYVENLSLINPDGFNDRDDYLLHCNKLWVYKYAMVNKRMLDSKKARRILKRAVRTCFLVGFHDEKPNGDEKEYLVDKKAGDSRSNG